MQNLDKQKLYHVKEINNPRAQFSWKRAIGITKVKQQISRKTGIPMTKAGVERKIGRTVIDLLFGKNKK